MSLRELVANLDEEIQRMEALEKFFLNNTRDTFKRLGIKEGMSCVDFGCGGGETTLLMAEMVGRSGHVTGIDLSPKVTEFCKRKAEQRNLKNLEFIVTDFYDTKLDEKFDLVYSSFALEYLDDPQRGIREILRVAKNGANIVIEDSDNEVWYYYPDDESVQQFRVVISKIVKFMGGDDSFGRKLYSFLRKAGLNPQIEASTRCITKQNLEIWDVTLRVAEKLREHIVGAGLVESTQFDRMMSELKNFLKREDAIFFLPIMVRAIARKP